MTPLDVFLGLRASVFMAWFASLCVALTFSQKSKEADTPEALRLYFSTVAYVFYGQTFVLWSVWAFMLINKHTW
jgi:hypothetical protein